MTEQQSLRRKKRKIWIRISIGIVLMILGAYYFYQAYQTKYYHIAQNDNDRVNPTGKRAVCFAIDYKIHKKNNLPYTIEYVEGDVTNKLGNNPAYYNYRENQKLSVFAQVGLLSEEKVGEDEQDRPIYRYDLTDKGREYVYWRRGMNFCFGRAIVEKGTLSTDKGPFEDEKLVVYDFHYENVPDWVMADVIKNLNDQNYEGWREALYQGKARGAMRYREVSSDKWRAFSGTSGITIP